jgi:ribonuclease G
MNEQILINVTPQETRVAVMQQGVVQELHVERSSSRGLVGNIYLGKVARVLPGMQSAFIDVGLARAAFLHVADIWAPRENGETTRPTELKPIEKILCDGQSILVQVIKDPIGSKGARLSTQIGIAGRYLVYLPQECHIGISQRIESEAERELLREKLQHLIPADESGGYIVRTVAETASDQELAADIAYLRKLWSGIREAAKSAAQETLLYQDLSLSQRVLRDFVHIDTERIIIDSRENFQKLSEFAQKYTQQASTVLEHYVGERPLFDLFAVEEEIEKALAKRVDLKSGGYIIIDQTEALTTVDVNTGGFVGGRNFDDTIYRTNLEASQTIARQLRLRNLGGIIIVDFIDMDNEEHKNAVLAEFNKALAFDRTRVTLNGFSPLGLLEMTRKRTRESLAHILCEPCDICKGRGQLKTPQTVCYEILRELLRSARQFDTREYRILASQKVIDRFLDEEAQNLTMLSDFIGKPISLQIENAYSQENYDVVLM